MVEMVGVGWSWVRYLRWSWLRWLSWRWLRWREEKWLELDDWLRWLVEGLRWLKDPKVSDACDGDDGLEAGWNWFGPVESGFDEVEIHLVKAGSGGPVDVG